ncbi:diguanylate cyclase [Thauera linaloolentis]|uniref:Diguanylate cyclase DosC n=1 Tax=Thauera linaloolentis (strain DSM 12138 / JCM 21573 / CCUG 41526 / CIP 105981 / IAM 15112 / NBRC 102519 / 47Lol) TaxID=1123367 RepID=N6YW59_THAL4|nr:diguanylate cyclase [Thauera linaloolentis]ENO86353.1 diguanylate cyclase [Thauera linaloolentis 47Lol = DSM 12138]MCM8565055.1 diguanylate cyclase [Thauera linaloolentis]
MKRKINSAEASETVQADWISLFDQTPPAARAAVRDLIEKQRHVLADAFYERMMQDTEARSFLDNGIVHDRLHASMQRWLSTLFSCETQEQFVTAMAMQRHVGEVHSRVDVPVNIVARGARTLKNQIGLHLAHGTLDRNGLVEAVMYVDSLIDLAFEVMSSAFVASHERTARIDEAYRSFSSGQNMSLERERQRSALLDWENRYLQAVMTALPGDDLPRINGSSFGLWMQHKAPAVFRGPSELHAVRALMRSIDDTLLPLCAQQLGNNPGEVRHLLKQVQSKVSELKFLTESMFERLIDLESGKDALTQLLNRRFLPAILARESEIARTEGKPFALLLIDVDHFKHINDEYGHQAGDRVLQQVAMILQNSVRAGDFVFRYGGEEFLVVLVEMSHAHAMRVAEKIRTRIADERLLISNGGQLDITVSIGVAMHDGHPDYQRLVNRADNAMYRAKQGGRNRCEHDLGFCTVPA